MNILFWPMLLEYIEAKDTNSSGGLIVVRTPDHMVVSVECNIVSSDSDTC